VIGIRISLSYIETCPDGFRPNSGVIVNMGSICSTIAIKVRLPP
jgi:hypothetical protein